jgi:hypothetical protein
METSFGSDIFTGDVAKTKRSGIVKSTFSIDLAIA